MVKARNPDIKALFYWSTDVGQLRCYEVSERVSE
jgi:hypothetical protein